MNVHIMNRFDPLQPGLLENHIRDLLQTEQSRGPVEDVQLEDAVRTNMATEIRSFSNQCGQFEFPRVAELTSKLSQRLRDSGYCTYKQLFVQLAAISETLREEIASTVFLWIPAEDSTYYEHAELFGPAVSEKFPSAQEDIRAAGSCYALGFYTASVFLLMRAVEHGLRAIARELGVPFDPDTWGTVIKNVLAKIEQMKIQSTDASLLEFYGQAASHIRNFQQGWRDRVSHGRRPYTKQEAMDLFLSVKMFMRQIAGRFSEMPAR